MRIKRDADVSQDALGSLDLPESAADLHARVDCGQRVSAVPATMSRKGTVEQRTQWRVDASRPA